MGRPRVMLGNRTETARLGAVARARRPEEFRFETFQVRFRPLLHRFLAARRPRVLV